MADILKSKRFEKIEYIEKGWSRDKKYCVTETNGIKYLLRISSMDRYENRKELFGMLKQVSDLGTPMCQPIEFGTCDDGVYSLLSWINGGDLETILPLLPETEQYVLGLQSGKILKKMHSIPAPDSQEEWFIRFNNKADRVIEWYKGCGIRFDGDDYVLSYIEQNRHLLKNRSQYFQHGDYHTGNMMIVKLFTVDDRY